MEKLNKKKISARMNIETVSRSSDTFYDGARDKKKDSKETGERKKGKRKKKSIYIYIIHTKLYCRYRMVAV